MNLAQIVVKAGLQRQQSCGCPYCGAVYNLVDPLTGYPVNHFFPPSLTLRSALPGALQVDAEACQRFYPSSAPRGLCKGLNTAWWTELSHLPLKFLQSAEAEKRKEKSDKRRAEEIGRDGAM